MLTPRLAFSCSDGTHEDAMLTTELPGPVCSNRPHDASPLTQRMPPELRGSRPNERCLHTDAMESSRGAIDGSPQASPGQLVHPRVHSEDAAGTDHRPPRSSSTARRGRQPRVPDAPASTVQSRSQKKAVAMQDFISALCERCASGAPASSPPEEPPGMHNLCVVRRAAPRAFAGEAPSHGTAHAPMINASEEWPDADRRACAATDRTLCVGGYVGGGLVGSAHVARLRQPLALPVGSADVAPSVPASPSVRIREPSPRVTNGSWWRTRRPRDRCDGPVHRAVHEMRGGGIPVPCEAAARLCLQRDGPVEERRNNSLAVTPHLGYSEEELMAVLKLARVGASGFVPSDVLIAQRASVKR